MFATKHLVDKLAIELIAVSFHALGNVKILALDTILDAALLAVEKAAWDSNVSVGFESLERFFEEVRVDVARLLLHKLVVVVKNLLDRSFGWENDEVVLAGDLLPIVDKNCLENVWNEKANGWLGAILLFL